MNNLTESVCSTLKILKSGDKTCPFKRAVLFSKDREEWEFLPNRIFLSQNVTLSMLKESTSFQIFEKKQNAVNESLCVKEMLIFINLSILCGIKTNKI